MSDIKNYDKAIEDLFIQFILSDSHLYVRCRGILSAEHFQDKKNRELILFLISHSDEFTTLPNLEQIYAITGVKIDIIPNLDDSHRDWFLKEFETFARHKALEKEILASPELLMQHRYGEVEANIRKAVQIGLVKDLGTDYFSNPQERLLALRDRSNTVSTGWKTIDDKLYGGFNRGELSIFAGQCVASGTMVEIIESLNGQLGAPQIVQVESVRNFKNPLYVSSPDGYVPVKSLVEKKNHEIFQVVFDDGTEIYTSPYHAFQRVDGIFISTINVTPDMEVMTEGGYSKVVSVVDTGRVETVYDLAVDHDNHRYFTNGICSHNSGSGKSIFLQNLGVNWSDMGLTVIYFTLELSERLTAMRLDAMVSGFGTKEVMRNIDDVAMRVRAHQMSHKGHLQLKQMPNGCNANDLRAYVKEYEIHSGRKVDAILVDYLDLMAPAGAKIDMTNMFVKDKYISEELRNLAIELNCLLTTASQLNRTSYDEVEFGPQHMAGGHSKTNTADNVMMIYVTPQMKEIGRYQIQFAKTRSSSGVGSKVDLGFDVKTLRVSDLDESSQPTESMQTSSIMATLKKSSVVTEKAPVNKTGNEMASIRNMIRKHE